MSVSGGGAVRANAVIAVDKYEPAVYEQPAEGQPLVRIHVQERFSGEWFVVPDSGTGELAGLRGTGGFRANLGGGAQVHLDYWFE